VEIVGALGAEGRWFDSTSSRHVGTLGKSFTRNCLYDGCGAYSCLVAKFDSCNSLLSSVNTLLVDILRCVRLCIKRKYYIRYSFYYHLYKMYVYCVVIPTILNGRGYA